MISPKHRLIEKDILSEIEQGGLAVGQQVATATELCQKYGVSRPTVDKAILNLASRGYLKRIQGRGTFVKNRHGHASGVRQINSISLLCSSEDLEHVPFSGAFMHAASVAAEKAGCHLIFCALTDDDDYRAPRVIRRKQVLGNLVLGFLNIIPYLGSIVGLSVALPLAFLQEGGGVLVVVWVLLVFSVVQAIEGYVLTPRIMGDRTGLHPMAIIVAVFFWGSALSGILGMVLAIPLTAFLVVFWRLAKERYIAEIV